MTCDDIEGRLIEGDSSAEVNEHLAGCAACRAFADELGVLTAPVSLSAADRAALASLEADTWKAWQQRQARARPSWFGYAAAAACGALVASAGFWTARPVREVVVERVVEAPALVAEAEEPNLGPDEVFFEVTWPDFPEGETP
ncbi:MAG: hypothetical protein MUC96_01505 [Myxococcaceae bacterium]|jgi:hypothetical protein|nr:hypothetical protein [Myxococcaceae bacterium]